MFDQHRKLKATTILIYTIKINQLISPKCIELVKFLMID